MGDGTLKYAVVDPHRHRLAFVAVDGAPAAHLARRGAQNAARAAEILGDSLGRHVLPPIACESIGEREYAIYPWRPPLRGGVFGRLERRLCRGRVLRWLRAVSSRHTSRPETALGSYTRALSFVQQNSAVPASVRAGAAAALEQLSGGLWRPPHVLDHNDLWTGNILLGDCRLPSTGLRSFVIIDWPGANPAGYGMYDLIRCAMSFRVPTSLVRREILRHCARLGSEPSQAKGHLLASLGRLGMNLGAFPEEQYYRKVRQTYSCLRRALGEPQEC